MRHSRLEQLGQPASRWQRFKKSRAHLVPATATPLFFATALYPTLDRYVPLTDSLAVGACYNLSFLGSVGLSSVAERLEQRPGRFANMTARGLRAASWTGPIALQLAGQLGELPLPPIHNAKGLALGVISVTSGILIGQRFAHELVDNNQGQAETSEPEITVSTVPDTVPELQAIWAAADRTRPGINDMPLA